MTLQKDVADGTLQDALYKDGPWKVQQWNAEKEQLERRMSVCHTLSSDISLSHGAAEVLKSQ